MTYDEALAKALRGEGAEELDSIVRTGSSTVPIRTDDQGNQNAPDIGEPNGVDGNGGDQEDCTMQLMMEMIAPGHPG